jgi:hypothetical protein
MLTMPDVLLHLIRPNPFRDFDLHPIDEAQVEKLRASIGADGFWASVVARPVGGGYEIAFGHHRIEAAKKLGMERVPIEVRALSDFQMVRMLASENATQRGTTAAASLDAIAALSRVITAGCLAHDASLIPKIFGISLTAAERVWGHVRRGGTPGEECLAEIAPEGAYTLGQIRLALSVLRDSGRLGEAKPIFDARCARLFRLDYHLQEFRRYVTDETVGSYLPIDQQLDFAQKIITSLKGRELTAVRLREQANILLYEQAGVARNKARRSPLRITDARVKDALNLMRRGSHDIRRSCNMIADLMAEGAEVAPEVVGRFTQYVSEIDAALKSLVPNDGGKRNGNLRLIVNEKENVA